MTRDDEIEVAIDSIGARGDGIGRLDDGRRVFVPFTLPGEVVRARIIASDGDGLAARAVGHLVKAPERVAPACRHFGECGGCALQHLSPAPYLAWKRDIVVAALARRGLPTDGVRAPVATPAGARRRADFTALRRRHDLLLGFNARASHRVIDLAECPVLTPPLAALLPPLRALLAGLLKPAERAEIVLALTDSGIDMLLVSGLALGRDGREKLAAFAHAEDVTRIACRHPRSARAETLIERRPVRMSFAGVPVDLPAGAFLQACREGETALTAAVLEGVGEAPKVLDLFAGIGTFTFPLARRSIAKAAVHAVDGVEPAIAALVRAAQGAGLGRVTGEVRDLERRPLPHDMVGRYDAVLFDPPRAGAKAQAAALARSVVPVVVAVSCNPATFARDARTLADGGYGLDWVAPVDQFLWSSHVELVARFSRQPSGRRAARG